MRVYVLILMSLDRCRPLTNCIALIALVTGAITICLLNVPILVYTELKYHVYPREFDSVCDTELAKRMGFVSHSVLRRSV